MIVPSQLALKTHTNLGCAASFATLNKLVDKFNERLNDPGHSILVRKSYNFARYLNLTFTDLENIANLLFKN
jgi:hypothetical protein